MAERLLNMITPSPKTQTPTRQGLDSRPSARNMPDSGHASQAATGKNSPLLPNKHLQVTSGSDAISATVVNVSADAARERLIEPWRRTLCGTPIYLTHSSGVQSKATAGGLVKVVTNKGDTVIYGLTAGHPAADIEKACEASESLGWEQAGKIGRRDLVTKRKNRDDLDSLTTSLQAPALERRVHTSSMDIGVIVHSGYNITGGTASSEPCYDWALFETSEYHENQLPKYGTSKMRFMHVSTLVPGCTGNRQVYLISASAGVQEAQLLPEAGSILLGSCDAFVDTFMVRVLDPTGNFIWPMTRFPVFE